MQYKHSKFCKIECGVHDGDISSLSVPHEVHHVDIVALHHLLADSWSEIIVDDVGWNKYQTHWPEKSAFLAGESF